MRTHLNEDWFSEEDAYSYTILTLGISASEFEELRKLKEKLPLIFEEATKKLSLTDSLAFDTPNSGSEFPRDWVIAYCKLWKEFKDLLEKHRKKNN